MSATIDARFKTSGVPETGLSPTVTIYNRTTLQTDITAGAMTEVGDGFYEYIFAEFDINSSYLFSFDGTAGMANAERYIESSWVGLAEWYDQMPRAGTGTKGITQEQFHRLQERLLDLVKNIKIEAPELPPLPDLPPMPELDTSAIEALIDELNATASNRMAELDSGIEEFSAMTSRKMKELSDSVSELREHTLDAPENISTEVNKKLQIPMIDLSPILEMKQMLGNEFADERKKEFEKLEQMFIGVLDKFAKFIDKK